MCSTVVISVVTPHPDPGTKHWWWLPAARRPHWLGTTKTREASSAAGACPPENMATVALLATLATAPSGGYK